MRVANKLRLQVMGRSTLGSPLLKNSRRNSLRVEYRAHILQLPAWLLKPCTDVCKDGADPVRLLLEDLHGSHCLPCLPFERVDIPDSNSARTVDARDRCTERLPRAVA